MKDIWVLAGEIYHTLRDIPVTPAKRLPALQLLRTRRQE